MKFIWHMEWDGILYDENFKKYLMMFMIFFYFFFFVKFSNNYNFYFQLIIKNVDRAK